MNQPRSRLLRVTAPAVEPITLAEAKAHLRVLHSNEDTLISGMITAIREHLDGGAGILGRALVAQTWDLVMDRFPDRRTGAGGYRGIDAGAAHIRVPLPPLRSVTSIKYIDTSGVEQTLSSSLYQVSGIGGHTPARIVPAYGQTWPSVRAQVDAVTIRFEAGYPDGTGSPPDAAENVPMPIKNALKLILGHHYEHRESVVVGVGAGAVEVPQAAEMLLTSYTVASFA